MRERLIPVWLGLAACLAACGGDEGPPTTAAPPTPAPTPVARVISASPAPGSTVSAGRNEPVTLRLEVTSPADFSPSWLCADYLAAGESSSGACGRIGCPGNCVGQSARIPAGIPQQFVISMGAGTTSRACSYPRVVDRVQICFTEYTGLELRPAAVPIAYTFTP
jgi:hypothetical protein